MNPFEGIDLKKYVYYRRPDFDKIVRENGLACTPNEFMKYRQKLDNDRERLWEILREEIRYSIRFEPLTQNEIQALQIMGVNKFIDNTLKLQHKVEEREKPTKEQIYSIEEFEQKKTTELATIENMTTNITSIKDNDLILQMQKEATKSGCRLAIVGEFYGSNYYINVKDPVNSINAITGDHGDAIIQHMAIEHFRNL